MNGTLLIPIPQRASFTRYGARLIDSMPPARRTSAEPARIMSDANMTVWRLEPHTLFTVTAPTRSGRPPKSAACRAGFWPRPAAITLPMRTSSMSAGTSPDRFTASATTVLPSLTASTFRNARPYLPTGVRHAPAITTSVRGRTSGGVHKRAGRYLRCRHRRPRIYVHDACKDPAYPGEEPVHRSDPPRWGGRGATNGKWNQTRAAGDDLPRGPLGGERGGHPDAHPEQHRVEGRAGDGLRGHADRGRRARLRRPGGRLPGRGDDGEQREPAGPRGPADGGPKPEHDDSGRADRVRGLWRGRGRVRDAAALLHRLAWTAPRAEGDLLRRGHEPCGHRGLNRIRGILAHGPPRNPGTGSCGL